MQSKLLPVIKNMNHSQHITQVILSYNEYIITGTLSSSCYSLSVLEREPLTPASAVGSCVAVAVWLMMSSSFSSATSCTHQRNIPSHATVYSLHTAHQRVSAGKYAVLVDTLPQLLVVLWLLLAVPEYLLKEWIWNRLVSHALLEELAHRGGLQEVVRLTQ